MLAKPEYFSPPNEVCCWQGRRGGAAGRGAVAELLQAGNRRHRGLPAGTLLRRAIGKTLLAGALQRRAIGKMLLAGSAMAKRMAALWQRAIGKSCWQGRLGRVAGRGRRRRPWEAGTATSSGKASNLPEGMHHREDAAGRGAAAKSHREASKERAPAAGKERAPAAGRERATPCCKRTKKRAAKPTLLSPL